VAAHFRRTFIDLDEEFCARIKNIGAYIRGAGYQRYVEQNSRLFAAIIDDVREPIVMSLSSGFLASDGGEVAMNNRTAVKMLGFSILLLPVYDIHRSADIIIRRQVSRGFDLKDRSERDKFMKRLHEYRPLADLILYGAEPSHILAPRLCNLLGREWISISN